MAAGKTSPQAPRRAFGSFPSDPRSPSAVSAQGDNSTPGSPASIVSVGSVGIERRCKHMRRRIVECARIRYSLHGEHFAQPYALVVALPERVRLVRWSYIALYVDGARRSSRAY